MKFYHGTSKKNWKLIQKEGILWGKGRSYRYTYLTPDIEIAKSINNEIILEIKYTPTGIKGIDNYGFNPPKGQTCWQFSVFKPIKIKNYKMVLPYIDNKILHEQIIQSKEKGELTSRAKVLIKEIVNYQSFKYKEIHREKLAEMVINKIFENDKLWKGYSGTGDGTKNPYPFFVQLIRCSFAVYIRERARENESKIR